MQHWHRADTQPLVDSDFRQALSLSGATAPFSCEFAMCRPCVTPEVRLTRLDSLVAGRTCLSALVVASGSRSCCLRRACWAWVFFTACCRSSASVASDMVRAARRCFFYDARGCPAFLTFRYGTYTAPHSARIELCLDLLVSYITLAKARLGPGKRATQSSNRLRVAEAIFQPNETFAQSCGATG